MKKPTKPLPYEMSPFHVFAAFNEPFANAVAQSTTAFAKGMQSVQGELAEFTAKRLRHDAETIYRSSCCENYEEFSKIQQKWLSDTAEDYMEEAGRVMGLGQTILTQMNDAGNAFSEELAEAVPPAAATENPADPVTRPAAVEKSRIKAGFAAKRAATEASRKTAGNAAALAPELSPSAKAESDANGGISTDN